MNESREEYEALRRIQELLEQANKQAEAPELGFNSDGGKNNDQEDFAIDPEMIAEAEKQGESLANQLETTNSILEEILRELQAVSNEIRQLGE